MLILDIPFFFVLNKVDLASEDQLSDVEHQIKSLIRNEKIEKSCLIVKNHDDVVLFSRTLSSEDIIPIFTVIFFAFIL